MFLREPLIKVFKLHNKKLVSPINLYKKLRIVTLAILSLLNLKNFSYGTHVSNSGSSLVFVTKSNLCKLVTLLVWRSSGKNRSWKNISKLWGWMFKKKDNQLKSGISTAKTQHPHAARMLIMNDKSTPQTSNGSENQRGYRLGTFNGKTFATGC